MKIAIVVGTRPEIIKMSPIIKACRERRIDHFILHTGQHYSYNLDSVFFSDLGLPQPKYNLEVGSGTHAEITGRAMTGIERVLAKEKPTCLLVEGDTDSVLAGALAAAKTGIRVGHVEAGLRSYDRRMPEEINRRLADHISDYLFAPTIKSRKILEEENVPGKIFVTGNTIVDAVNQSLEAATKKSAIVDSLGLEKSGYFLATVHRQENVDDRKNIARILESLEAVAGMDIPIVYPMHPRTGKMLEKFNLKSRADGIRNLKIVEPLSYLDFLSLEANARLILTDSGGIQEEACILKIPCVTLRSSTERPETVEVGGNAIAGLEAAAVVNCVHAMLRKKRTWKNPFGDGTAGRKIVRILRGSEMGLAS
ncbi:MAG: UDP-N-acetylglucosamine 2-epimerase (non-hydrolyzing) [Candidatus Aenigmarchaeota archaeon]|nr:UDP-N-acetylglucosamine 2-epimerase (non-hydrolyzing) [Candidatus Aenigmarchaeota archaeon]